MLRLVGGASWSCALQSAFLAITFLVLTAILMYPEALMLGRGGVLAKRPMKGSLSIRKKQCVVTAASHSLKEIARRVFDKNGEAAKSDAGVVIALDTDEQNRRAKMGDHDLATLDRSQCAGGVEEFVGAPLSRLNETNSKNWTNSTQLMRNGCPVRLLLIVIFNGDFHGNVPFIRSLYETAFSKVVFYSQSGSKEHGVRASPKLWGGYKQHIAIAQAMMEFPGYDGYWWIGDDVLLNYPYLFATMDMKKVWTTRREEVKGRAFPGVGKKFADNGWVHWNTWYGMDAVQKLYSCLRPVYVQRMPAAFACSHCVVYMGSDAGYIPAGYVEEFLELAYVFRDVLHEITLPTALRLMVADVSEDLFQDFDTFLYVWEGDRFPIIQRSWHVNTSFAHPLKFSAQVAGSRQFAVEKLAEARSKYGHLY